MPRLPSLGRGFCQDLWQREETQQAASGSHQSPFLSLGPQTALSAPHLCPRFPGHCHMLPASGLPPSPSGIFDFCLLWPAPPGYVGASLSQPRLICPHVRLYQGDPRGICTQLTSPGGVDSGPPPACLCSGQPSDPETPTGSNVHEYLRGYLCGAPGGGGAHHPPENINPSKAAFKEAAGSKGNSDISGQIPCFESWLSNLVKGPHGRPASRDAGVLCDYICGLHY